MPIDVIIPPAGVSPASLYYPKLVDPATLPPSYLADSIAPIDTKNDSTGVTVLAGDLTSINSGMDPTDAAVLTALRAERGSGAALGNIGQRFRDIDLALPTAQEALKAEATYALRHLIKAGDIAAVKIEAIVDDDNEIASVDIVYDNLRTGENRRVPL